jgi:hypothetical protein
MFMGWDKFILQTTFKEKGGHMLGCKATEGETEADSLFDTGVKGKTGDEQILSGYRRNR